MVPNRLTSRVTSPPSEAAPSSSAPPPHAVSSSAPDSVTASRPFVLRRVQHMGVLLWARQVEIDQGVSRGRIRVEPLLEALSRAATMELRCGEADVKSDAES